MINIRPTYEELNCCVSKRLDASGKTKRSRISIISMLALGRLFPSSAEEEKDYGKEVDSYLQRINESVLLPDRRDAVFQLRDLLVDNTKAQLAFGSHGFPTMCTVLQEHRTEIEMVRAALEAIVQATNQDNRHSPQVSQTPSPCPCCCCWSHAHTVQLQSHIDPLICRMSKLVL